MEDYGIDEPPSQLRLVATLLGVVLLAAFNMLLLELLRERMPAEVKDQAAWSASTDFFMNCIYLVEALVLCGAAWTSSGMGVGSMKAWKRYVYHIAFVWIMPPLVVLSLYPALTTKPFHNWPVAWWVLGSIAQELLFTGFIYGRLVSVFGAPSSGALGAFSAPMLVTSFLYALSHWPNLQIVGHGLTPQYVLFQFVYSFVGFAWMLNIRRWTGSIWPGVLNHVLVNFLATAV
jgi:membrane protease YdiL (CAAX protease family)